MGPWTRFLQPQQVERDKEVAPKEYIKLANIRSRGYVRMVEVKILTHYFSFPKGDEIRMVLNGASRVINAYLWAPHFALTEVGSTLRSVERGNFMADRDVGEIFSTLC